MQDFIIDFAAVIIICSPMVAIVAFGIYKGDYSRGSEPSSLPDELELQRRANETTPYVRIDVASLESL